MSGSIVSTLRAMANNYAGGHSWDHLDGEAVNCAAEEIDQLRARLVKINEIIFAVGAPLGSDNYFKIRELCTKELTS